MRRRKKSDCLLHELCQVGRLKVILVSLEEEQSCKPLSSENRQLMLWIALAWDELQQVSSQGAMTLGWRRPNCKYCTENCENLASSRRLLLLEKSLKPHLISEEENFSILSNAIWVVTRPVAWRCASSWRRLTCQIWQNCGIV